MAAVDTLTIPVICSGPGSIPLPSKTNYSIIALTAANIVAQSAAAAALATATNALTDGNVAKTSIAVETFISSTYPTVTANRGQKWVISATNGAGQPYTYTIPAAKDTSTLLQPDLITADLTATAWVNYKTAFEALATDRAGGALTLTRAKLSGRRR